MVREHKGVDTDRKGDGKSRQIEQKNKPREARAISVGFNCWSSTQAEDQGWGGEWFEYARV